MSDHRFTAGFIQLSRAWYAEANLRPAEFYDEVSVGFHDLEGGGGLGEITIEFYKEYGAKIEFFSDSLFLLDEEKFAAFFTEMGKQQPTKPWHVVRILKELGFEDITPEKRGE